jgi:hypothetical protein
MPVKCEHLTKNKVLAADILHKDDRAEDRNEKKKIQRGLIGEIPQH